MSDNFVNADAAPKKKSKSCLIFGLIGLALFVVIPLGSCIAIGVVGFQAVKAPVNAAVEAINADAEISAALGGDSSHSSGMTINNYQNNNSNGGADVEFNITGPSQSAQVKGKMTLTAGQWRPENLTITTGDGTTFQLPRQ